MTGERELYKSTWEPDWAVPPGETLSEILEERGIEPAQFALEARFSPEYFQGLLEGTTAITESVAERLEQRLGTSARLWLGMQKGYEEALERIARKKASEQVAEEA